MPSGRRAKADAGTDQKVTRRLVLQRVSVIEVPEGIAPEKLGEAIRLLMGEALSSDEVVLDAWAERGEYDGSQRTAIEAYAGKPGTSDAKVGTFKAVPVRNWKGGARYSQPALPKVERELLP